MEIRELIGNWYADNLHWVIPTAMIIATIIYKFFERRNNEKDKEDD